MGELIKRLEAATGPDRELDVAICRAIEYEVRADKRMPGKWFYEPVKQYSWQEVPAYTASLDAALTLVAEGWLWTMWAAQPTESDRWAADASVYYKAEAKFRGEGVTPALALCIAALRARASHD